LGAVPESVAGSVAEGTDFAQGRLTETNFGRTTDLQDLFPLLQNTAGNIDLGTMLGESLGAGVAGAVVTAIIGLIKNRWSTKR
jgi:hypothetical protein